MDMILHRLFDISILNLLDLDIILMDIYLNKYKIRLIPLLLINNTYMYQYLDFISHLMFHKLCKWYFCNNNLYLVYIINLFYLYIMMNLYLISNIYLHISTCLNFHLDNKHNHLDMNPSKIYISYYNLSNMFCHLLIINRIIHIMNL